jgi:hypothetical protein
MKKNYGKIIIELLREHPEGLSISEIAKLSDSHRHTITKYIYKLIGAEIIRQRSVGAAKLCYLKEKYSEKTKKKRKKGQLQVLTALLVLLLIPTAVIVAQNVTDGLNRSKISLPVDLCVDVSCEDSTATCPDGWVASCSNACNPATGECSTCTSDCAEHEVPVCNITCGECEELDFLNCVCNPIIPCCGDNVCDSLEVQGEAEECLVDCGLDCDKDGVKESWTCEAIKENITQPSNETNTSVETTTSLPSTSTTSTTTITGTTSISEPPETLLPKPKKELKVETFYPERITRGETVELMAKTVNTGSNDVENVTITWELPERFEVVSSKLVKNCGTLGPNVSCVSSITVQTLLSSKLGINEIKVVVNYE